MRSPEGDSWTTRVVSSRSRRRPARVDRRARPGFRPNDFSGGGFPFSAELTFEPVDGGTRYTARVMHANAADHAAHDEMGFLDGWGAALDQLVEYMSAG